MRTSFGICSRKKRYATQTDAARAATNATLTLRPYRCSLCRDYHLTSRTKGMFVSRQFRHPGLEPGSTFSTNCSIKVDPGSSPG